MCYFLTSSSSSCPWIITEAEPVTFWCLWSWLSPWAVTEMPLAIPYHKQSSKQGSEVSVLTPLQRGLNMGRERRRSDPCFLFLQAYFYSSYSQTAKEGKEGRGWDILTWSGFLDASVCSQVFRPDSSLETLLPSLSVCHLQLACQESMHLTGLLHLPLALDWQQPQLPSAQDS